MNVKKESLRDKILEYLSNNPSAEVKDIATYVQISKQALYYHIKLLTTQKKIQIVDSQFVNGIEKKFYSLNAPQDPDNTDNQAVLVDDDSSTSSTNTKQKKSPLPQSIDDNTQKTSVLDLDNTLWGGIIGDDGFQFVHPNTDGAPVPWRDAFQTIILVPPSSNNGVYHGEVESAWYADGELVEPVGSMSRLPNSFLEVGIAQQCYAIWFEEEQRWDW